MPYSSSTTRCHHPLRITLCRHFIRMDRYVTFCNEQNIQRVQEPDRLNITKCGHCLLLPLCRHFIDAVGILWAMNNFFKSNRCVTAPSVPFAVFFKVAHSSLPAMPLSKASLPLYLLARHFMMTFEQLLHVASAPPIPSNKMSRWTRPPLQRERSVTQRNWSSSVCLL